MSFWKRILGSHRVGEAGPPTGVVEPGEALLVYEWITRFPTRQGNWRVQLLRDGRVFVQRNEVEPPTGEPWCVGYPDKPLKKLRNPEDKLRGILQKRGFFEMQPAYRSVASDGYREIITYTGEDRRHAVEVQSRAHPPFGQLAADLLKWLGVA